MTTRSSTRRTTRSFYKTNNNHSNAGADSAAFSPCASLREQRADENEKAVVVVARTRKTSSSFSNQQLQLQQQQQVNSMGHHPLQDVTNNNNNNNKQARRLAARVLFVGNLHAMVSELSKTQPDLVSWQNDGAAFWVNPARTDELSVVIAQHQYFVPLASGDTWKRVQSTMSPLGWKKDHKQSIIEHPCFHRDWSSREQLGQVTRKNALAARQKMQQQKTKEAAQHPTSDTTSTATPRADGEDDDDDDDDVNAAAIDPSPVPLVNHHHTTTTDGSKHVEPNLDAASGARTGNNTKMAPPPGKKGMQRTTTVTPCLVTSGTGGTIQATSNTTTSCCTQLLLPDKKNLRVRAGTKRRLKEADDSNVSSSATTTMTTTKTATRSSVAGRKKQKTCLLSVVLPGLPSSAEQTTDDDVDDKDKPFAWHLLKMMCKVSAIRPDLMNWVDQGAAIWINKENKPEVEQFIEKYLGTYFDCKTFEKFRKLMSNRGFKSVIQDVKHKGSYYAHPHFHRDRSSLQHLRMITKPNAARARNRAAKKSTKKKVPNKTPRIKTVNPGNKTSTHASCNGNDIEKKEAVGMAQATGSKSVTPCNADTAAAKDTSATASGPTKEAIASTTPLLADSGEKEAELTDGLGEFLSPWKASGPLSFGSAEPAYLSPLESSSFLSETFVDACVFLYSPLLTRGAREDPFSFSFSLETPVDGKQYKAESDNGHFSNGSSAYTPESLSSLEIDLEFFLEDSFNDAKVNLKDSFEIEISESSSQADTTLEDMSIGQVKAV